MQINARILLLAGLALAASPAFATVTSSVSGTTLTATSDAADAIAINCSGANVLVNGANPGTGPAACAPLTTIAVNGGPGANNLSLAGVNLSLFPAVTSVTVNGAAGSDLILGSAIADVLIGDAGDDTIDGNQGNDTAFLGAGNDVFAWDPGDGSDIVEGQGDLDTLRFNGSNIAETIVLSANGGRMLLTRNVANIVMDCDNVERVEVNALGGADLLGVNPMQGTDLAQVTWNLAASGGVGDGAVDIVTFNGGAGADNFDLSGTATQVLASDGFTTVAIPLAGAEPASDQFVVAGQGGNDRLRANVSAAGLLPVRFDGGAAGTDTAEAVGTAGDDTLVVAPSGIDVVVATATQTVFTATNAEGTTLNLLGGNDTASGSNALAALTTLTIDGGSGDDTIGGGDGADLLIGGDGNDLIDGNRGNDIALMGADNDTFAWDPGDGSDIVEGQAGSDILRFSGANISETFQLSPNGGRVTLFRDVAAVTMDMDDTERVDLNLLGGTDNFTINDLAGTDVTQVAANLAASIGGGDGATDIIVVNATNGADAAAVSSLGPLVLVARPGVTMSIAAAEPAADLVVVNGLAGDDTLSSTIVAGTLAHIVLDGGANIDIARVDGEDVAESFLIAPVAANARLTRTAPVAATIDANNHERIVLLAGGGVDAVGTQLLPTLVQSLDGGDPSTFPGGDTLTVANAVGEPAISPIVLAGFASIFHANFDFGRSDGFLNGPQVVPPTPSPALGTGTVTLNAAANAVTVVLAYSGLGSSSALVHLHCPGARGANGPVVLDLPPSGATSGSFTAGPLALSAANAAALQAGNCYLDVHSVNFPNGEIRGQLDNVQFRDGFE